MDLPGVHIIHQEEVETAPRLLPLFQNQAFGRGIPTASVGFDDHGFDIEKDQNAIFREMPPTPTNTGQDAGTLRIGTDQLALDPAEVYPPFFSTRDKCFRLIVLMIL